MLFMVTRLAEMGPSAKHWKGLNKRLNCQTTSIEWGTSKLHRFTTSKLHRRYSQVFAKWPQIFKNKGLSIRQNKTADTSTLQPLAMKSKIVASTIDRNNCPSHQNSAQKPSLNSD